MNKIIEYLTAPSVTSFGDNVYRPRWKSILSDLLCLLTLGYIKPVQKEGEECYGQKITTDQKWNERVAAGRCGKCNHLFDENLHRDAGGGMCTGCWARSH